MYHTPILPKIVLEALKVRPGGRYIDATLGGGGHAKEIVRAGGKVLGIDRDPDAIKYVQSQHDLKAEIEVVKGNFRDIGKIANEKGYTGVDGIIFDLGISSHQLDEEKRGFSFRRDEELDMRMDPDDSVTAKQILNTYSKKDLYDIFTKFAEEVDSRYVSESIVRARLKNPLNSTNDLIKVLGLDTNKKEDKKKVTRVFQAIRIEVNNELENLKIVIPQLEDLVKKGGRVVFISFHSLEDRTIKLGMLKTKFKKTTTKPIIADLSEQRENPRSKSAKLRIYEKI